MGKRNSQRKNAAILESDDDSSSSSSSDRMSEWGTEEVQVHKDSLLEQALDALYEKRGSTRERALASIIDAFNSSLQHGFLEKKFATLLHQCLNSIKRGSSKEISLASHAIGLLALTVGSGNDAHKILEDSITPFSQALKSQSDSSKISSVVASKPSAAVITAVVSAWAFLLTTMDGFSLNPMHWQESISYLSSLLDKDDRSVRIATGEALALIFEIGSVEKFCGEAKGSSNGLTQDGIKPREGFPHIQGLKGKIINQVRNLSAEAGGRSSAKKDLNSQRKLFRDILDFFEYGYCPETTVKIGGESLQTSSWSEQIQLNFLKRFLGGGFIKHMKENEFLHDVFGFTPKKYFLDDEHHISSAEKRMYRSPNSVLNKARTQLLNKQRMLSEGRNLGHFAVNVGDEEV
ncbi:interferon-related developmental regulator 1-like isoform X3 [Carya illinoinensis]|uniref:interferon-related developmental regulator 1-like isoform X3 n=1 Tax=Carya illinoinensis TaxID=32201 RepID=UPI001C7298D5|nr:interferon-related developmental regulator 1-like isoform X3 [Carya illinoinensis]